jgi:hypothetical protein
MVPARREERLLASVSEYLHPPLTFPAWQMGSN